MGHHKPLTPIQTDNTTVLSFVTKKLQPRATKSTDMNFWWMRDRFAPKQFRYYLGAGNYNNHNSWTKHFCEAHHRKKRANFLTP